MQKSGIFGPKSQDFVGSASNGFSVFPGVVAGWSMNDGSGTTFAGTPGFGNPATVQAGTLTWQSNAGLPGTTPLFSSTAYATASNAGANFNGSTPFSVSAWMNISTLSVLRGIVTNWGTPGWGFMIDSSNHLHFYLFNTFSTNMLEVNSSNTITANALHHVVVTYDGSKAPAGVTFYTDGVAASTATVTNNLTGSTTNSNPIFLGSQYSGGGYLGGVLAFARIFNRLLSAADVSRIFALGPQ